MTQRYTTFIPGYVFNIFWTSIYARRCIPIYILYYYSLLSSEPALRKIFPDKVHNIELSLRALLISILCTAEIFGSAFGQVFK